MNRNPEKPVTMPVFTPDKVALITAFTRRPMLPQAANSMRTACACAR